LRGGKEVEVVADEEPELLPSDVDTEVAEGNPKRKRSIEKAMKSVLSAFF
jgi:hypothetical protein